MSKKRANKQLVQEWQEYINNYLADVSIDTSETEAQKRKRIVRLEADPEAWFAYYFPEYCTAPPAGFHKSATRRLLTNNRWYEVRSWCRGMAKSARSMMEVVYLALTGKVHNVLIVSNSYDNAVRLALPFQAQLEKNLRITNDYGEQMTFGNWEAGEFVAKCGCAFRALGAGQSPRGTRNRAKRPDFILVDDIDTDEEVRNNERISTKWKWIEDALLATLDVSSNIRILFNGNIIGKDTCITRAGEKANHWDVINIRDKHGKSSWIEKNSEADIDYLASIISTRSLQKEYYNNPLEEGGVFKEMFWETCPPLSSFHHLVCYGDPSPSNSKSKASSMKSVVLAGLLKSKYYILSARINHGTNAEFVQWFYDLNRLVPEGVQVYNFIENNTLQDPVYQQVIVPLFVEASKTQGHVCISPDTRKKPDKFTRVEGNLEPLNKQGRLILNGTLKKEANMQRLEEQFLLLEPKLSSPADGPDCVEGAVWKLNEKAVTLAADAIVIGRKPRNNKRM